MAVSDNPYRNLPAVNDILQSASLAEIIAKHGHDNVVAAVRMELAEFRRQLSLGRSANCESTASAIANRTALRLERELQPRLRAVINATGIVLHTIVDAGLRARAPVAVQEGQPVVAERVEEKDPAEMDPGRDPD